MKLFDVFFQCRFFLVQLFDLGFEAENFGIDLLGITEAVDLASEASYPGLNGHTFLVHHVALRKEVVTAFILLG